MGHAGEGVEITNVVFYCEQARLWLQLGHAGEGVEMLQLGTKLQQKLRFNWATPVKAWRLSSAPTPWQWRTSFNWATPVKAWR